MDRDRCERQSPLGFESDDGHDRLHRRRNRQLGTIQITNILNTNLQLSIGGGAISANGVLINAGDGASNAVTITGQLGGNGALVITSCQIQTANGTALFGYASATSQFTLTPS